MGAALKMILGIVVFLAGVYWYVAPLFGDYTIASLVPLAVGSTVRAFLVTFFGLFGLGLILFGLIIAWIEFEDMKWEKKERKNIARAEKKKQ